MVVTAEKLEQQIDKEELNSIYILYGSELYVLDNILKKLKKKFEKDYGNLISGINYIQIAESNQEDIISNIETPAFGFEKKLIIARNAEIIRKKTVKRTKKEDSDSEKEKEKKKNTKKEKNPVCVFLENNIDLIAQGNVLVIIEDNVDTASTTYKALEDTAVVTEVKPLSENELIKKLGMIFKLYGVNTDAATVRYIIATCGTDMQVLINEIRKLIEYTGKGGKVTQKEVDLLCTKEIESTIFDLTDSIGAKNITLALEKLDEMLYNKEPIQKIIVTLYGHFKKLYIYKLSKEKGRNIAADLNLTKAIPFLLGKYDRQARCFSKQEIKDIMFKLMDLDTNSKVGKIDPLIGLQSILCRYCGNE